MPPLTVPMCKMQSQHPLWHLAGVWTRAGTQQRMGDDGHSSLTERPAHNPPPRDNPNLPGQEHTPGWHYFIFLGSKSCPAYGTSRSSRNIRRELLNRHQDEDCLALRSANVFLNDQVTILWGFVSQEAKLRPLCGHLCSHLKWNVHKYKNCLQLPGQAKYMQLYLYRKEKQFSYALFP